MSLLEQLNQNIAQSGGLIVSCQPVPNSPLDKPEIVAAMALACLLYTSDAADDLQPV